MAEKYNVENKPLEQVLGFIKSGQIAIPEIQRPFVWKPVQVRDLIDSLYMGYPTGYLIVSQSPSMKLKDGTTSSGKQIMIDGQQRVTALMTAIVGTEVSDSNFKKHRIIISFNPLAPDDDEEKFKVQTPAVIKDKRWIADIADVFKTDFDSFEFVQNYCAENNDISPKELNKIIMRLIDIKNRQIGIIKLNEDVTIDEVTEIFIRINSQGTKLNQADFAMSRMAANEKYGGNALRKAIEYFSHLAISPDWYNDMCKDEGFMQTPFATKMSWLRNDKEAIYDPDYNDILRVSFMYKFGRAKMKDLVALLEGRNFETRENEEWISEETFQRLQESVLEFMNQYSFTNFILAIKSAGFISTKLINSQMTLDFAYTLYLILHNDPQIDKSQIKHYVQRWYLLSTLTSRYITSPESVMDYDIKRIKERGFLAYFNEIEPAELSETFWVTQLPQRLESASVSSPFLNVFFAAQIFGNDNSLFCKGIRIGDLIDIVGDVHHIFPRKYLMHNDIKERNRYNQIANFTYLDTVVNKLISDDAPNVYFHKAEEACKNGEPLYGNIDNMNELKENLKTNCIPENVSDMSFEDYDNFLDIRRKMMAGKIRQYYYSL
ncbi:MAG: DUF262 domain-containing protein [Bacteroidales bacterium]|nr:DUF262 domain-containing protein [Bacteroidales bacterium]